MSILTECFDRVCQMGVPAQQQPPVGPAELGPECELTGEKLKGMSGMQPAQYSVAMANPVVSCLLQGPNQQWTAQANLQSDLTKTGPSNMFMG